MAALLHQNPVSGAPSTGDVVARFTHAVQATLNRRPCARPPLARHWIESSGGHLSCYRAIDIPLASLIPPD